ncbi:MAG: AraC family ligand binding domain-containing protein, partial [Rhodospirillaceae bacterium]
MQHNSPSGLAFFALYGEPDAQGDPDFVHIEDIRVRSRLYDWRITPHAHPRMFQIVVLLGGTAEVQIDRELHHIEAPGVVCLPGSVVHGFVFEPESVGWVVTVSELLLAEAGETPEDQRGLGLIRPVLERPRILSLTDEPEMKAQMGAYLEQMHSEFHQIRLGHATMVHWLLRAVLILVRRRLETEDSLVGGEGRRRVQFARFRQLVETHFKEHWPVEAYADALALSQARLNRLCRGVAGKGP